MQPHTKTETGMSTLTHCVKSEYLAIFRDRFLNCGGSFVLSSEACLEIVVTCWDSQATMQRIDIS